MADELKMTPDQERAYVIALAESRMDADRLKKQESPLSRKENAESVISAYRSGVTPVPSEKGAASRVAGRLNKGLLDLITMPTNLINAGIGAVEWFGNVAAPGGDGTRVPLPRIGGVKNIEELAYRSGITPDPEVAAETIPERAAEILGGSVVPVLGLGVRGNQVLQASRDLAKTGWLDHLAVLTAKHPATTAIMEPISSVTAATAGSLAKSRGEEDHNILMAELLGGFTPAALISLPSLIPSQVNLLRAVGDNLRRNLLPFTKSGATVAASKRLQRLSPDPGEAAARIDVAENLSAARQAAGGKAAEKRLLGLERFILEEDPVMDASFQATLNSGRKAIAVRATEGFAGDKERARELLRNHRDYTVNLVNLGAAKAAKDAAVAVRKLDPGASQTEISRAFRTKIEAAHKRAKETENQLYDELVSDAPGNLNNARAALDIEIDKSSVLDDPNDIPKWLIQALKTKELDAKTTSVLRKQGFLDENDQILPSVRDSLKEQGIIKEDLFTFNDLKALRSRILREVRKERALDVPNRNKIRILNNIVGDEEGSPGLMADLAKTGVTGFDTARAFSRQVNLRFGQGRVGDLLGYQSTGEKSIADEISMEHLIGHTDAIVSIKKLRDDHPELLPDAIDHIKKQFLSAATKETGIDPTSSRAFIRKWETRGLFEDDFYPDLKAQFERVRNLSHGEKVLQTRAHRVRSLSINPNKSKAAFYLQKGDIGDEMKSLLSSDKPVFRANDLVRRIRRIVRGEAMAGDPNAGSMDDRIRSGEEAITGLKSSFIEEGIKESSTKILDDGTGVLDSAKFTQFMNKSKNRGLLKAFDFDESEIKKLDDLAALLRKFDAPPGGDIKGIMEGAVNNIMKLFASYLGAQTGGRLGSDMGSRLVLAGGFSENAKKMLLKLTRNHAQELLIAAHQNTPEGRELYRALLTRSNDDPFKQERAALKLRAFVTGVRTGVGVGAGELSDSQDE